MPNKGAFKPGDKRAGRRKGAVNRATTDVRAAIAEIAQANVANVQSWLERTARKQPSRALQLYLDLIEYHIPKLARTEHGVDPAAKTAGLVTVMFLQAPKND